MSNSENVGAENTEQRRRNVTAKRPEQNPPPPKTINDRAKEKLGEAGADHIDHDNQLPVIGVSDVQLIGNNAERGSIISMASALSAMTAAVIATNSGKARRISVCIRFGRGWSNGSLLSALRSGLLTPNLSKMKSLFDL